eukprot:CAMPEP_0113472812 /NCGR_PEP_ID=MMETSP0014_2-20120614/17713_1 /TAXON_ID=2857 /ORGANISM="Nitzschia sp." /LENGTH=718 /DNA_ID=CAMNT_0000365543 /DNA_START=91 /DNA_END=2244 /DNA_ORIENTATION=- /assembly_acc=CAM_ASM_000159
MKELQKHRKKRLRGGNTSGDIGIHRQQQHQQRRRHRHRLVAICCLVGSVLVLHTGGGSQSVRVSNLQLIMQYQQPQPQQHSGSNTAPSAGPSDTPSISPSFGPSDVPSASPSAALSSNRNNNNTRRHRPRPSPKRNRPIRRFRIKDGTGIFLDDFPMTITIDQRNSNNNNNSSDSVSNSSSEEWHECHDACHHRRDCDMWQLQLVELVVIDVVEDSNASASAVHDGKTNNGTQPTTTRTRCSLYANNPGYSYHHENHNLTTTNPAEKEPIQLIQSPNNDPNFLVGMLQRRATTLRLRQYSSNTTKSQDTIHDQYNDDYEEEEEGEQQKEEDRILYILHFHHRVEPERLQLILDKILPTYLPHDLFDVTVITPSEERLPLPPHRDMAVAVATTLVNPFGPTAPRTTALGANSYMSLPIAMDTFPNYKGYILVNDDAIVRFWGLIKEYKDNDEKGGGVDGGGDDMGGVVNVTDDEKVKELERGRKKDLLWFSDRAWVTFPTNNLAALPKMPSAERQVPRGIKPRYPYGKYDGWGWWNYDSGSAQLPQTAETRDNFDATLTALAEVCQQHAGWIEDVNRRDEYCTNRTSQTTTLTPYVHGKSDVFYIPNSLRGRRMAQWMHQFGEHDVTLEAAVPIVYHLLTPDEDLLTIPYCDGREIKMGQWRTEEEQANGTYFSPYYSCPMESRAPECAVMHPIKFSRPEMQHFLYDEILKDCEDCQDR